MLGYSFPGFEEGLFRLQLETLGAFHEADLFGIGLEAHRNALHRLDLYPISEPRNLQNQRLREHHLVWSGRSLNSSPLPDIRVLSRFQLHRCGLTNGHSELN